MKSPDGQWEIEWDARKVLDLRVVSADDPPEQSAIDLAYERGWESGYDIGYDEGHAMGHADGEAAERLRRYSRS